MLIVVPFAWLMVNGDLKAIYLFKIELRFGSVVVRVLFPTLICHYLILSANDSMSVKKENLRVETTIGNSFWLSFRNVYNILMFNDNACDIRSGPIESKEKRNK